VWADGLLFVSAAYGAGCAALEITADGDRWAVREKWTNKEAFSKPLCHSMAVDGHLYGCHGDLRAFFLRCLDLKTGAMKWEARSPCRTALLAVDGALAQLGRERQPELARSHARARMWSRGNSQPADAQVVGGAGVGARRLYLRDERHALCLDLRR